MPQGEATAEKGLDESPRKICPTDSYQVRLSATRGEGRSPKAEVRPVLRPESVGTPEGEKKSEGRSPKSEVGCWREGGGDTRCSGEGENIFPLNSFELFWFALNWSWINPG